MTHRFSRYLVAASCAVCMYGCASTTPQRDARFGESIVTLRALQTQDPEATERNAGRPVVGMEADAAANAVRRYSKSFAEPPQPVNVINLGIGGAAP